MLGRYTCERCQKRSLDQGRVTFVGVARSEKPLPPRPMLLIEFECSRCKTVYRIHEDRPIEHIVKAVESFGRYDDDFVLPGPDGDLPDDVEAEAILNQNETEQKDNSTTGITDEEVTRFLKRLKRTSFKCQSKSLRAWLSRLGIDPDRSADDLLDEPPDEPSSEPPF
jgi:hypothetical protein